MLFIFKMQSDVNNDTSSCINNTYLYIFAHIFLLQSNILDPLLVLAYKRINVIGGVK